MKGWTKLDSETYVSKDLRYVAKLQNPTNSVKRHYLATRNGTVKVVAKGSRLADLTAALKLRV